MIMAITELKQTSGLMNSTDYKDRFKAEYYQTKIRYEKLKSFNNHIEAAMATRFTAPREMPEDRKQIEMPKHDCPIDMLRDQQGVMEQYLHVLEVRAVIEGIEL